MKALALVTLGAMLMDAGLSVASMAAVVVLMTGAGNDAEHDVQRNKEVGKVNPTKAESCQCQ